jgi:glycosyltransferase involved in cell wall biosynthesis
MRAGDGMRILLWHGWLLSGTGSNVASARVAEAMRAAGHDVLIVCQERHPDRFGFLDGWGEIDDQGRVGPITASGAGQASGRAVVLRPHIGSLLPVFVYDEYEGFERVVPFVDLTDGELHAYLETSANALRAAVAWHDAEGVLAGHIVPGGPVAHRATDGTDIPFAVKVHGSDLEYAVRLQGRYRRLAAEGVAPARAVFGPTADVLDRTVSLVPATSRALIVCSPGVDLERFRPGPRAESLEGAAALLESDGALPGGRPRGAAAEVVAAVDDGMVDTAALDAIAGRYDQSRPDQDASAKLRALEREPGPLLGYLGKLIPQKGVHLFLAAMAWLPESSALLVGFGTWRERLEALTLALDRADEAAVAALWPQGDAALPASIPADNDLRARVTFTGRLDHRYASLAVRAMDVLVVPSILEESFGMVAAEGAAAGALPLVARHSGLAEVAGALEEATAAPGLFSFDGGVDAVAAIRTGVRRLLDLDPERRASVAAAARDRIAATWTWDRSAERYVEAFRR